MPTGSHSLSITPLYAAALALLFVVLSVRVILARRAGNIGFGSGGSDDLERRIRIQANFAEYVPLTLLVIAMAELRGVGDLWIHACCLGLLLGRILHAAGLSRDATDGIGRVGGMAGTLTSLTLAAGLILVMR